MRAQIQAMTVALPPPWLLRQIDLRVEVAHALERPFAHPLAVVLHVLGKALGIAVVGPRPRARMDRLTVLESRRDLNHSLADHDGHGIEVATMGGQPESLAPPSGIDPPPEKGS